MIDADELEAFQLLHCGPIDVDRGVLSLLFSEVHEQLLRFVAVEEELVPLRLGPHHPGGSRCHCW